MRLPSRRPSRWCAACAAASIFRARRHEKSAAATPAPSERAPLMAEPLQPRPAVPPFEPPALPLLITSGGAAGGPLSILLFPQLAASGWLMRTQVAFFHAALASSTLLALDGWRLLQGVIAGAQLFQTGLVGFGYFATVGIALALG